MFGRLDVRVAVPMVVISLMLLGLGVTAAWNVQRQQVTSQNLIVAEIEGLLSTQSVYMRTREILHLLLQHQRTGDAALLASVASLRTDTEARMEEAKRWPRTPEEMHLIGEISGGYAAFWTQFDRLQAIPRDDERSREFSERAEESLVSHVIEPAEEYIRSSQAVVERTNEASRNASELTRQGFLLLGLCGCAGGLVAGWAVAKLVQRSLVQLDISVRSAAGRLGAVATPVTFTQVGDLQQLESGLSQMELHIVDLVERLQLSETQMLRSEQLAHLGQLAAGLAHELRNPLMPIKTLVHTALERGPDRGMSPESLQVISREIQRLEETIQTFLDFARPQAPAKTRFNLAERLKQLLELVAPRARQQQTELQLHLASQPIEMEADAGQIHQVLLNLLLNACDALGHGGRIDVTAAVNEPPDGPRAVVVSVADNGAGLPANVLEHIFEPFVTTKETGTGLGLSICQRLIEAHGGSITARNRPEGGAEFRIELPLSPPASGDPAP